jgi:hypothetical protein
MRSIVLSIIILILLTTESFAQLERQRVVTDQYVELTFMAPRNINLFTVEPLSKGELHYSIMHTFGEVNSAQVISGELTRVPMCASVLNMVLRIGFRWVLAVQVWTRYMISTPDGPLFARNRTGTPVSVTLAPSLGITTGSFGFLDQGYSFNDRISYSAALPVARKFSNELSVQLVSDDNPF